jgi:hypothetical protein
LGRFRPNSLPRASPPRPTWPVFPARSPTLPSPLPLPARPHLSARTPLALLRSLSPWQAGPARQRLPRAHDRASEAIAVGHCPPHCLTIIALTSSVWRLTCARAIPSPRLPEPSHRHHCAPPSPSWRARLCTSPLAPFPAPGAYKRTAPSSPIPHPGLGHLFPLPRAQLSQRRRHLHLR